jgi:hypothetical protein
LETQATLPVTTGQDSIESFGPSEIKDVIDDIQITPKAKRIRRNVQETTGDVDNGLRCECEVSVIQHKTLLPMCLLTFYPKVEDECTFCEGGCGCWFHIWQASPFDQDQVLTPTYLFSGAWGAYYLGTGCTLSCTLLTVH